MRVRWMPVVVVTGLAACATSLPVVAATTSLPPESTVPPSTVPGEQGAIVLPPARGPLVIVPTGCAVPAPATAVFDGELEVLSYTAARFRVVRQLAGSLDGLVVAPLTVDVVYGQDARFLEVGTRYLVGAAVDESVGGLRSKVRQPAPLFGGDAVVGLHDTDVDCPVVEDPVRTLMVDGTSVDSGVLRTVEGAGPSVLRAVIAPLAVAFGILICLVLIKQLVFAIGRALRELGDGPVPARRRRHRSPGDEPLA